MINPGLGALVLTLAMQAPAQQQTSFAFAHTDLGATAWNVGRMERVEGRNAVSLARLHYFRETDAAAGRPFPFVVENVDIDCDDSRSISTMRAFFEVRETASRPAGLYLAASEMDERSVAIREGTPEHAIYRSACEGEAMAGHVIAERTTMDALAELVTFSRDHPVIADVVPGAEAVPQTNDATSEP